MAILRLLSEEVFDFSKDSLTAVGAGAGRACASGAMKCKHGCPLASLETPPSRLPV